MAVTRAAPSAITVISPAGHAAGGDHDGASGPTRPGSLRNAPPRPGDHHRETSADHGQIGSLKRGGVHRCASLQVTGLVGPSSARIHIAPEIAPRSAVDSHSPLMTKTRCLACYPVPRNPSVHRFCLTYFVCMALVSVPWRGGFWGRAGHARRRTALRDARSHLVRDRRRADHRRTAIHGRGRPGHGRHRRDRAGPFRSATRPWPGPQQRLTGPETPVTLSHHADQHATACLA